MDGYEHKLDDVWTWQTFSAAEEWEEPDGNWFGLMVKKIDNPPWKECLSALNRAEGLEPSWFGPFETEGQAKEAGERFWHRVKDNLVLWGRWVTESVQDEDWIWLNQTFGR